MKEVKTLAVKTGSYTDRSGNTKARWKNVGGIFELQDGGKIMLLDRTFNPAGVPFKEGSESIMISMFDPKPKDGNAASMQAQAPTPAPASAAPFDDDITF